MLTRSSALCSRTLLCRRRPHSHPPAHPPARPPAHPLTHAAVLLLYEGDARSQAEAKVRVRLVDFAHTFQSEGAARDDNFLASVQLASIRIWLRHNESVT